MHTVMWFLTNTVNDVIPPPHHTKLVNKQNVNEIEFSLITTILLIYHINVRQMKVSEINTQS